jgi:hypothetical protein
MKILIDFSRFSLILFGMITTFNHSISIQRRFVKASSTLKQPHLRPTSVLPKAFTPNESIKVIASVLSMNCAFNSFGEKDHRVISLTIHVGENQICRND